MNAAREARLPGQRDEILAAVETGNAHPAMAAFGLLADDNEWDDVLRETYLDRGWPSTCPAVEL